MVYSRKFKHPKEDLLEEGKRIINESRDSKFLFRVTMVNLMLAGAKASELSPCCGVDERTLTGWVAKVDEHGFESLMAVKQTGRPPKLSNEQKEKIKDVVSEDPQSFGYSNWDGPSLSDYILRTFDVEYSVRQSQRLLRNLGYSLIRPQIHPSTGNVDDESRIQFKQTIAEINDDPGRVVVFQDEVHFNIQSTVTRMWAIRGSKPRVGSKPGRESIVYSGFVIPKTGALWLTKPERFNFETTIESIRAFLTVNPLAEGKRYCLVMDNAPWHKKAMRLIAENMDGKYDDIREQVDFVRLPPYSPDLNPIEQVWRMARKERTHNRCFWSKDHLASVLDGYFDALRAPNEKLRNLCSFSWMLKQPFVPS